MAGFDRDKAVSYADSHWNVPCDDGVVWLSNDAVVVENARRQLKAPAADGWKPVFVKGVGEPEKFVFRRTVSGGVIEEKMINGWAGLADCAHFLSRCLTAGGVAVAERGVRGLVDKLAARADTRVLCEQVPRDRAQRVIDTGVFKKGDMLGYFNVDPQGDYGGRPDYSHSTMFVGKIDSAGIGGVTCHTVARFPPRSWVNDSWWLHDGYTYTLIHFNSDDQMPDSTTMDTLEGWWQLDYSGRTEYYHITRDRRAHYKKTPPKSAKEQLIKGEGGANWFVGAGGKIIFIWRATGTVEVWTPGAGGYSSMINGVTPGTLAKMFST